MTRNGKIARLPHDIREELNQRIRNGQAATQLMDWLHEQDEVWEILDENDFDPINDQNISDWKSGGYQTWLDNKEARDMVMELAVKSQDLGEATPEANLGVCVGNLLMVELIKMAKVLVQQEEDPHERMRQLKEVNLELTRLRWANARDARSALQEKRRAAEEEDRTEAQEEKQAEWVKKQRLAPYELGLALHLKAEGLGGSPAAKRMAARLLEVQHDLPKGRLTHQENGVWMWEEDEWVWYVDRRKAGRGFVQEEWKEVEEKAKSKERISKKKMRGASAKGKNLKSKKQTPEKQVEDPEAMDESQKAEDVKSQGSTESRPTFREETAREDSRHAETGPIQGDSSQFKGFNE